MKKLHNENYAQAVLRHAGENALKDKATEMHATKVREAGVSHLAGRALLAATIALPVGGLVYEVATQHGPHQVTQLEQEQHWQNLPNHGVRMPKPTDIKVQQNK